MLFIKLLLLLLLLLLSLLLLSLLLFQHTKLAGCMMVTSNDALAAGSSQQGYAKNKEHGLLGIYLQLSKYWRDYFLKMQKY